MELDSPFCEALEEVSSMDVFPMDLVRNAAFLAMGTAWVLAWGKWLQVASPLLGCPGKWNRSEW